MPRQQHDRADEWPVNAGDVLIIHASVPGERWGDSVWADRMGDALFTLHARLRNLGTDLAQGIAIRATGADGSVHEAERAFAQAGHVVVSNSRNHRMELDVPLLDLNDPPAVARFIEEHLLSST